MDKEYKKSVRGWLVEGLRWRGEVLRDRRRVFAFNARLHAKWLYDRFRLPLLPEHYPLYRIIQQNYHKQLGCFPNLVNCRDYNDKIQWLKLFDQDEAKVRCSALWDVNRNDTGAMVATGETICRKSLSAIQAG
jgi:hypothetical protein